MHIPAHRFSLFAVFRLGMSGFIRRDGGCSSIDNEKAVWDMRKPYKSNEDAFVEDFLVTKEPYAVFDTWFKDACNEKGIKEANAMAVATADKAGRPSCRYVLLKAYGKEGFCFFTNYHSRKGKELEDNPYASLLFYWEPLSRQIDMGYCTCVFFDVEVRIEGPVVKVSKEESEKYFHCRPLSSQIAAVVSRQSTPIASRKVLIDLQSKLEKEYGDPSKIVPKPDYWGGYRVVPEVFEFWQGQTNRLHDRIRFRRSVTGETLDDTKSIQGEEGWIYERLSP